MNASEAWAYADWVDTALTIGQIALVVGCPTAGVTWLAARIIVKQIAKAAIKRVALATAAGVVATAAASFISGGGEGSNGSANSAYADLGISQQELLRSSATLVVGLDDELMPQYTIEEVEVPKEDLSRRLLIPATVGQLREIRFLNQLPRQKHGEWALHARSTLEAIVQLVPDVKVELQQDD
jgi:hypothetical protein